MDEAGVKHEIASNPSSLSNAIRPTLADKLVVGLEDEIETIKERLTGGRTALDVFSIFGMGGIGKTTIAEKVYEDLQRSFHVHAFCRVSQPFDETNVLLELLLKVTQTSYKSENMSYHDLGEILYRSLKGRKYLIILDDVWDKGVWEDLKSFFPDDHKESRVLFTSRQKLIVKPDSPPHELRLPSEQESLQLLEKKVFHQGSFPPELLVVGWRIVKGCKRLPLAIVVLAGILTKTEQERKKWEQIADSLHNNAQIVDVFELSYKYLPQHLKRCFLYFAAFPEDFDVPVRKLIQFWIAESLIPRVEEKCLEDLAEDYLTDLIGRSLVMESGTRSLGGSKTCNLHDLTRDFCLEKAKEENFMQQVHEFSTSDVSTPRLCIYSEGEVEHLGGFLSNSSLAALLWFRFGYWSSRRELLYLFSYISSLKDLSVLDLGDVFIDESFFTIQLPVHLRFLSVSGYIESIPPSIVDLSNLETLIVKGDEGTIDLPDSLWNMAKLRHLRVQNRVTFKLPDHPLVNSFQLENLQTLSYPILSHGKDLEQILTAVPSLRKLKCSILQKMMSSPEFDSYPQLEFLSQLESLHVRYSGFLVHSSAKYNLPETLKKLTLVHLPWNNISTLAELPNLEVLKILSGSFEDDWCMGDEEFLKLRILKLCSLGIEKWDASKDNFPRVQKLIIERCEKLECIPSNFAELSTLKLIDVKWCSRSIGSSVRKILEEQEGYGYELKVHIYPED